jgi:hypothetical protein
MKKPTHKRENGLQFTHVKIKPIVKNRHYISLFSYSFNDIEPMMDTTIGGESAEECLKKTEKFLQTNLKPSEYTFF